MALDESADRRVTLEYPRSFVEQTRRGQKRREVDRHPPAACRLHPPHRTGKCVAVGAVPEELKFFVARHTELPAARQRIHFRRGTAVSVFRIEFRGGFQQNFGIFKRQCEDRYAVEGAAGRNHAAGTQKSPARLDADQFIERRRNPSGTGGIGAERKAAQSVRQRRRRAAARTARHITGSKPVRGHAIRRAYPDQPGRELVHIGFAERHGAGFDQEFDHPRRPLRSVGVGRTGRRGRNPGKVDVVFDCERDAVKRQRVRRQPFQPGEILFQLRFGNQADPDSGRCFGGGPVQFGQAAAHRCPPGAVLM